MDNEPIGHGTRMDRLNVAFDEYTKIVASLEDEIQRNGPSTALTRQMRFAQRNFAKIKEQREAYMKRIINSRFKSRSKKL